MAELAALQIGQDLLGKYNELPPETKNKIFLGVDFLNQGGSRVLKLPYMLVAAAFNFFILAVIFVLTLRAKLKALFDAGDQSQSNYMRNAFLKGLGLALVAVSIIFISDLISGGFASMFMIFIYPLAGIATLIMSFISPSFLEDIRETNEDGTIISRISGFRLWSISFWTIFALGMVAAIVVGLVLARVGNKLTRGVFDLVSSMVGDTASGSFDPSSLVSMFTK